MTGAESDGWQQILSRACMQQSDEATGTFFPNPGPITSRINYMLCIVHALAVVSYI